MRRSHTFVAVWVTAGVVVAGVVAVAALLLTSASSGAGAGLSGVRAASPATTVAPGIAPSIPAHGAYTGAYVQPADYSQHGRIAALHTFQGRLGRRLDIVHQYLQWDAPFPTPSERAMMRQGSTLLLSWAGADTRAIAAGRYDRLIRQRARAIRATHKPVFLEWRWEMNRTALESEIHSPHDYVAAWDHIRSIFTRLHVRNVAWVWCPSSRGFGSNVYASRPAPPFYPGNSEVDWVCADVYPRGAAYFSFAELAQPFLAWASHIHKPIMIGEYGAPRIYGPQQRAQWLRAAAQTVREDPQIKGIVYFDGDPLGNTSVMEYALDAGSAPFAAFRAVADAPYFNPGRLPVRGHAG
jgi:hypothetical protein